MKVIQVGLGGMGNAWLRTVQNSTEVTYAGFVEVNETIAQQQARQYSLDPALIFASLPEALAAVVTDGVINITPPAIHQEISTIALEAGVPVLSEKPLADTMAAAREIVRIADETGVLHMVTQNYRYHVPVQTMKQILVSGKLGRIGAVNVEFFKGPHFGGFRDQMAYPLIIDMAIHHFDLMRFFLESDPVSIFGRSWNPPWSWYKGDASAAVTLEFADGAVVCYNGSWCATGKESTWNATWRFEGEHGVAWLEDDQVYLQLKQGELENMGSYQRHQYDEAVLLEPVALEYVAQDYLLHEFYQAVMQGMVPATLCQDNIKSLAIVFDIIKSFESGQPVRFGESLRD